MDNDGGAVEDEAAKRPRPAVPSKGKERIRQKVRIREVEHRAISIKTRLSTMLHKCHTPPALGSRAKKPLDIPKLPH